MTVCLDEMGPVSATTYPGQRLVRDEHAGPGPGEHLHPKGRAPVEPDYGYRGSFYVYGSFVPATGAALTACYPGRCTVHWLDFLEKTDAWLPAELTSIVAILDNLGSHRSPDILFFLLTHPRWHFLFIPKRCAYLNLVEAWWKVLRSLALKGNRFENASELEIAIDRATQYWNRHKHPFVWGRRRRHQPRRKPGIACMPSIPCFKGSIPRLTAGDGHVA